MICRRQIALIFACGKNPPFLFTFHSSLFTQKSTLSGAFYQYLESGSTVSSRITRFASSIAL